MKATILPGMIRLNLLRASRLAAALFLAPSAGSGVTFISTSDPAFNTTAPTGTLAGSGWQYEASFGPFLATAIGPHHFLTAQHIGVPANIFLYQGANYTIVRSYDDPGSDLRIFEVAETLPAFVPLYSRSDEAGRGLVVIGRGTRRGDPVYVANALAGWQWGNPDEVQRWGESQVTQANGLFLYATFDQNGQPNESDLSSGDSGGAVFINDGGVWKVAGINYGVDGPFATTAGGPVFYATLFDMRGLFDSTLGRVVTGSGPVPSGFYAVRTSMELAWIRSIVAPALNEISTKAQVGVANSPVKASFVLRGDSTQTKRVLVRGLGPSLQANGAPLAGRLTDPAIDLYDGNGTLLATNDNWNGKARGRRRPPPNPIQATGFAPTNASEAALIATLPPGSYTAVLRGAKRRNTGVGLLDVHDLDDTVDGPTLKSVSAYGAVGTGTSVLTSTVMAYSNSGGLLIRTIGPELLSQGVTGALSDPTLEVYDASGALVASNDNWRSAPNSAAIQNTGLAPGDDRDAAVLFTPAPGSYTVIVRGANGTTGICLLKADLLP
ncbi:MAG TPA: hypothetical protein VGG94_03940 [Chthoniobacterales bacterium]